MSKETLTHLNTQTLIGYTDKRGTAWHYRAEEQGAESNHYPGPVPVADVRRRLFNWKPLEADITVTAITEDGVISVPDPTRKAILRPDTGVTLGIFKKGYRVHDYEQWLIDHVESILDADVAIGSAGLLRDGGQAWVQVEMEDTLSWGDVEYRPFMTAATSLDGTLATTYMVGAQVVVCDNTLSMALGDYASKVKIRHSRNSLGRLSEVRDALGILHQAGDDFAAQVDALQAQVVTEARWQRFLDAHAGDLADLKGRAWTQASSKRDALENLWNHDLRVAPWSGTAWGVLSAVNTYTHHLAPIRGADRVTRNMDRMVTGGIDALDRSTLATLARV